MYMRNLYYKIFAFLFLSAAISGCKLDGDVLPADAVLKSTDSVTTTTSEYYFKGTLNGQTVNWPVTGDINGWFTGSGSATSNNAGDITGSLSALITAAKAQNPAFEVEFGTFHVLPTDVKSTIFNAFIQPGSFAYGTDNNAIDAKFITISYTDSQGNFYTSATGTQTGSTANVVSVTPVPAGLGTNESLKIKLTFSCTLYPIIATGTSITLTNAEATVLLENLL